MLNNKINISMSLFIILILSSFSVYSKSDNQKEKAIYLVAQISIKDYQEYMNRYGKPVTQLLVDAGADILVASRNGEVLEGEWSGNWTVITKFPSKQAVKKWYNSKEYDYFKKMRVEELMDNGNIVLLPSLK